MGLATEDGKATKDSTLAETALINAVSNLKLDADSVCYDSGASNSLFNNLKWFSDFSLLDKMVTTTAANGISTTSNHGGTVYLLCNRPDKNITNLTIYDTSYTDGSPLNLLSAGKLRRYGVIIDGYNDWLVVKATGEILAKVNWFGDVATLDLAFIPKSQSPRQQRCACRGNWAPCAPARHG